MPTEESRLMRYDPPERPTSFDGALIGAIVCGVLGACLLGPFGAIIGAVLGMAFGDQVERDMVNKKH